MNQGVNSKLQALANEKLARELGTWRCRWEFLDGQGAVASKAVGTQTNQFVLGQSVMQVRMNISDSETESIAHRFYDPMHNAISWLSVDNQGDLWHFVEEVDGSNSRSLPHKNRDGSTTWLRFHALRETDHESDIVMELSHDEINWAQIFRMYKVRQR